MSRSILIPSVNDSNKGDQALVWESVRLIEDVVKNTDVRVIPDIDAEDPMTQSKNRGLRFCYPILRHPRRGRNNPKEAVVESKLSLMRQVVTAMLDCFRLSILLIVANKPKLTRILFSESINETLDTFRKSEYVFVKGGGFLHAYGGIISTYTIWYFLFYIRLALRVDSKVIILPNSFGPFKGPLVKWQMKTVLKKCSLIFCRERVSQKALAELNIKSHLGPDLGFFLDFSKNKEQITIPDLHTTDMTKVGFTIRPWRFPGQEQTATLYEKYLDSIVEFIRFLTEKGHLVYLFNQSIGPNSHEDDRIAVSEVVDRLKEKHSIENVNWVNYDLDCSTLKSLYSELDFMIGTRFHSVIFALTSEIPCIAIAYGGNKAFGIMESYGLSKYVVSIDDVSAKKLIKTFEDLTLNKSASLSSISEVNLTLNIERDKLAKRIMESL